MTYYAEKGNRVRRLEEHEVQKYTDLGYTIKDEKGAIIVESAPNDITVLQTYYKTAKAKIDEYLATIESLNTQINALKDIESKQSAEIESLKAELSAKQSAKRTTKKAE